MESKLDQAKYWFLEGATYRGDLHLIVSEGKLGEPSKPSDFPIGGDIFGGARPLEVHEDSATLRIVFEKPIAWQVVDESYTTWDEYEVCDDKNKLKILSRSRYLDYVKKNHDWFEDIAGPAQHYRVWTLDEVVDVIAHDPPTIENWVRNDLA